MNAMIFHVGHLFIYEPGSQLSFLEAEALKLNPIQEAAFKNGLLFRDHTDAMQLQCQLLMFECLLHILAVNGPCSRFWSPALPAVLNMERSALPQPGPSQRSMFRLRQCVFSKS